MEPRNRSDEGSRPDPDLDAMYQQYRELREMEGPKAGDEEELLRLELEMSDACAQKNQKRFLDIMLRAILVMDGCDPEEISKHVQ